MEEEFDIAKLIAALLAQEATDEEYRRLEAWKNESPEHLFLFDKIVNRENLRNEHRRLNDFTKEAGWEKVKNRSIDREGEQVKYRSGTSNRMLKHRFLWRYAAVLTLALGAALSIIVYRGDEKTLVVVEKTLRAGGVQLKLSDGTIVNLQKTDENVLITDGETVARNYENTLSYQGESPRNTQEVIYNEIYVPRGEEYKLKLSDGTKIILNSMSTVRFPVVFGPGLRKIELKGEAYLEVAKDSLKPFVVATSYLDISVLGTKFNISSYEDDMMVTTTLVEGAVRVSGWNENKDIILRPNEQLVFNKTEKTVDVANVDVRYSIAWKDEYFRFRDIRLEELMKIVMRWYDVEVVYEDPEIKDYIFGCNFSRLQTIEPLMRIFENNGKIKVTKTGRLLKISKGR